MNEILQLANEMYIMFKTGVLMVGVMALTTVMCLTLLYLAVKFYKNNKKKWR